LDDNFLQGQRGATFTPILRHSGKMIYLISVQQKGKIAIEMRRLKNHSPFDNAENRDMLFKRIENIPGLKITEAGMEGFPKIPVSSLTDEKQLLSFIDTLDWIVSEIRATTTEI
jgi:hypothetical protein